jgi:alkylation response protein AidB-like acyl-CoA dehydrogenase
MHEEPEYLPWEFAEKANEWGLYSMWLPRIFGGRGLNMPSLSPFLEEISTSCLAMANLIGVHYLGVGTLSATWNLRLMNEIFRDVARGERTGRPCLISLAITEPSAGTDVEDVDLLDRGKVTCLARRVDGGWTVNGSKIFISNGHLSTWHMVIAYSDLERPSENTVVLAVKTGAKGFSFGRHERKMGQRACPASELIFDDCFVADEYVCFDQAREAGGSSRPKRKLARQMIDYVVSTSRAGVCAFGSGVARGAYQEALEFAAETKISGRPLINHQWAQCLLAEMYKNAALGRLAFAEANYANSLYGLFRLLLWKPFYYSTKYLPRSVIDGFLSPLLDLRLATRLARKLNFDWQKEADYQRTSGWASLAKFAGADAGVRNCQLALELMGAAGLRQDRRVEKHLRDAKLLQIYEGTNQLNRLNLFKCLVARQFPQTQIFEPEP